MSCSPCDGFRRSFPSTLTWCLISGLCALPVSAAAQNVNYGAKYDSVDRTVVYVSTWFEDAKVTSARRDDGSIDTIVEDASANILARSNHRNGSVDATLAGFGRLSRYSAKLEGSASYATDWFNKQLYVLWRDQDEANRTPGMAGRALPLQWHRGHLRIRDQIARERMLRMPDPVDASRERCARSFESISRTANGTFMPNENRASPIPRTRLASTTRAERRSGFFATTTIPR